MLKFLSRASATDASATAAATQSDQVVAMLSERLSSLDGKCLEGLVQGLRHAADGDFTFTVVPVTTAIDVDCADPALAELVRLFNSMLGKAQASLEGYDVLRSELRESLGDQSVLAPLTERLHSLSDNCLAGLGDGIRAAAGGDLTVEAVPCTTPVEAAHGQQIGELGDRPQHDAGSGPGRHRVL